MIQIKLGSDFQTIQVNYFPNGEIYFNPIQVDQKFDIIWYFENNESIIELIFFIHYLDQLQLKHLINELNIAYLPYSRMDRIDENNQNMYSLQYLATMINSLNLNKIRLNDIHSDVALKLIKNSYNINITKQLFDNINDKDITIMFPDKGAFNRYKNDYPYYNKIYGEKIRDFKTGQITGLEIYGDLSQIKDVVIIDDLTSKGTTFVKSAEKLKQLGFKNIKLIVAHAEATMSQGELFKSYINEVITTDSMLKQYNKIDIELNCEQMMTDDLGRALFDSETNDILYYETKLTLIQFENLLKGE